MQKFHRSQEEPRRTIRAYRHFLEKKIDSIDWLRDASHAKVLMKSVGAKLHICLIDYVMRGNGPNYTCKSEISSTQNDEIWMVQQKYAKESFSGIRGFCTLTTLCSVMMNITCVEEVSFLTTSCPWWNVKKRFRNENQVIFDYVMQGAIVWILTALTEVLLQRKRKRSGKALNLEREL